jgi:predicted RNA-binding protein with PIN domain
MHYYIDGYNLMFRMAQAEDSLQTQRDKIIRSLNSKIQVLGIHAVLVFDSHHVIGEATRCRFKNLEIVFTSEGETADEYILEALRYSGNSTEHIVVTSDKQLARMLRGRLVKTESVEKFCEWLNTRYKNKLRKQKEKKPQPKAIIREKASAPPSLPNKDTAPEECLNFYLDIFEKNLAESSKIEMPAVAPIPSDKERWLKAFSRLLEE